MQQVSEMTAQPGEAWNRGEPSVYGAIATTVERHPLLTAAAVATAGAIVVLALKPSSTPRSRLKSFERRLERETRNLERRLRASADRSGLSDGISNLIGTMGDRLSSVDVSRMSPFTDRASAIAGRIVDRIAAIGR